VVAFRDVTDERSALAQLQEQALRDPLTGLASWTLLQDRLRRALDRAAPNGGTTAVLAIDVDRFHRINHSFGHDTGDQVLLEVGRRIQVTLRGHDTVARPCTVACRGGDEFFVLCEDVKGQPAAATIAARLADTISAPMDVGGRPIAITASVGIALQRLVSDPKALIVDAEVAMHEAKSQGPGHQACFAEEMGAAVRDLSQTEAALHQALEEGQLRLAYQPKLSLPTGQIAGVEALLRWEHPERGTVPPAEFIPLAERSGLIVPIGAWALEEACRQATSWEASFPNRPPLQVSVNVSARQFDADVVGVVARALDRARLGPGLLCLEVTESTVMRDVELAVATIGDLKALGVTVSIDDFGTGYSSLAYLRRLPLDEIKVDKSFVDGLGHDPEDTAIVAAVVAMAHALDLVVVAEGVETEEQMQALRTLGCEYVQGYYLGCPQPPEALDALLVTEAEASWAGNHAERQDPATQSPGTYRSTRVVVADDTPDVLQLARLSLTTAGFEVYEACAGREAIALVEELAPDCVILDVMMPDMDGFEVCRTLRAHPADSNCTIVMLTSMFSAENKIAAFSAGADDYIVKPFAPRDLVSRVRAAMNRRLESSG
jgi:diguanylate cyclase (GGDEF)-like protein